MRDSAVPLFVAQGSRDDTTLAADLFALEAIRQQPRRSLRYVVVEQGDHAFETPDRKSHLAELFDDFLAWALDAGRQTSLGTLKETNEGTVLECQVSYQVGNVSARDRDVTCTSISKSVRRTGSCSPLCREEAAE